MIRRRTIREGEDPVATILVGASLLLCAGATIFVVLGVLEQETSLIWLSLAGAATAGLSLLRAHGRLRREDLWSSPPSGHSEASAEPEAAAEPEEENAPALLRRYTDRTLLSRIGREARAFRLKMAGIFSLELLGTPLLLLTPLPVKIAVDSVLGDQPVPGFLEPVLPSFLLVSDTRLLFFAAFLQIAVVLLHQSQIVALHVLRTHTGERMTLGFRARLFAHVQRLSLAFHDMRGTTDSIYRIQYDAPALQNVTIYGFITFVSSGLMLLGMLFVTARIDVLLAIVALLVTPLLFMLARYYNKRMRPRYRDVIELESSALKVVQEVLTASRVVKAFGREEREKDRFLRYSGESTKAQVRLSFSEGAFGLMVNAATALGTALVLFVGISSVQAGRVTLGELLMVIAYLTMLYAPLQTISKQIADMQWALASMERAFELMDEAPEVEERADARALDRASGAIEFEGVSFSYDGGHKVLEDVSFAVERGTRVGIEGRTGAGKTTLVSLLVRFYDPGEGAILLDGVDVRDYRLADLRDQFSLVLQDPVLFSTTIAENIAYARPDASMAEIEEAARAANAHGFVTALPDGYDTLVGERGMRLSGGERQRISLARAFLKDAPVLILDEPTSSVDIETEAAIIEAMDRLMRGRTSFMIAHRVSTLESCDVKLRLVGGTVKKITPAARTDGLEVAGTAGAS